MVVLLRFYIWLKVYNSYDLPGSPITKIMFIQVLLLVINPIEITCKWCVLLWNNTNELYTIRILYQDRGKIFISLIQSLFDSMTGPVYILLIFSIKGRLRFRIEQNDYTQKTNKMKDKKK